LNEHKLKTPILCDTSPLITMCAFRVRGKLVIEHLSPVNTFVVVDTVASEATANPAHPDTAIIQGLLQSRKISRIPVPTPPISAIIDNYTKLGQGERDTIRLATMMSFARILLDDYLAFVVAKRFDLEPILLLDFVVSLVKQGDLRKAIAFDIIQSIAPRYSTPFIEHTRHKLNEISDDSSNNR